MDHVNHAEIGVEMNQPSDLNILYKFNVGFEHELFLKKTENSGKLQNPWDDQALYAIYFRWV